MVRMGRSAKPNKQQKKNNGIRLSLLGWQKIFRMTRAIERMTPWVPVPRVTAFARRSLRWLLTVATAIGVGLGWFSVHADIHDAHRDRADVCRHRSDAVPSIGPTLARRRHVHWGCTTKNKVFALKFAMCVVCMNLYNICSDFSDNTKILDFIGLFLWKIKILSFWVSLKISKFEDSHFVERLILRLLTFLDCVLLQNCTF